MAKCTICLSYFNQVDTLKYHLNIWKNFDDVMKEFFNFIITDDCSLNKIEDVLDLKDLPSLKIYRVIDDLVCNISGVRNLCAQKCSTDWMLIIDMDTIVNKDMALEIMKIITKYELSNGHAFKFNRKVLNNSSHEKNNKMHPAVCLIKKADYWKVGGCDEDLVGHYGQTDPMFWYRAKDIIKVHEMKHIFLEYNDDGEANINRDTKHNRELFNKKKKKKNWSSDYIRFKYLEIL